jgi:hypothetical protein
MDPFDELRHIRRGLGVGSARRFGFGWIFPDFGFSLLPVLICRTVPSASLLVEFISALCEGARSQISRCFGIRIASGIGFDCLDFRLGAGSRRLAGPGFHHGYFFRLRCAPGRVSNRTLGNPETREYRNLYQIQDERKDRRCGKGGGHERDR